MFSLRTWRASRRRDQAWEATAARVRADAEDRQAQLVGREEEVRWLEALLFENDPIGLNFEDNTDEYRAEAQSIALRRSKATSVDDVRRIVHEQFVAWFDANMAGPPERYEALARTIWLRWDPNQSRPLPRQHRDEETTAE